jgi:hypothetical protein
MPPVFAALRSGAWLTCARMRRVALALLAIGAIGFGWLAVTSDGLNDRLGRPLGTDFANVYAAGSLVREGRPTAPFDGRMQHARQQAIFGAETPFYGWHYPPFFLFVAVWLARLPYAAALLLWQGATLALYLCAIAAIVRRKADRLPGPALAADRGLLPLWLLLALAYPAVLVNLGHGHNGFLTAALLGAGLVLLEHRPWLAGVAFGLLAYKPQFGLLLPLVLAVAGAWRSIAAAALTVLGLIGAATLAFGPEVWVAFLDGTRFTRVVVLEAGETGWHKIQSVFALARMWGLDLGAAYALQACVTVSVALTLAWLWRSAADFALKAAALPLAAVLATPYSLDYDLMALAPALAFFGLYGLGHGLRPYEASAIALMWLVPLFARSVAEATSLPLAVPAMLALFGLILVRAAAETGARAWRFAPRGLQ